MKKLNYYGQKISVSDEVAEFLEQDRLRETAQRGSDQRHINFMDVGIASVPDLFTDEPSDPNLNKPFEICANRICGMPIHFLSDDDRKLLYLYYCHEYSMAEIGATIGVTKMAISKRLRKILDHLRSLMEHEAPQNF